MHSTRESCSSSPLPLPPPTPPLPLTPQRSDSMEVHDSRLVTGAQAAPGKMARRHAASTHLAMNKTTPRMISSSRMHERERECSHLPPLPIIASTPPHPTPTPPQPVTEDRDRRRGMRFGTLRHVTRVLLAVATASSRSSAKCDAAP